MGLFQKVIGKDKADDAPETAMDFPLSPNPPREGVGLAS